MTEPLDLARQERKSALFDFVVTALIIAGAVLLAQILPHRPPPCDNALPWLACDKVGR